MEESEEGTIQKVDEDVAMKDSENSEDEEVFIEETEEIVLLNIPENVNCSSISLVVCLFLFFMINYDEILK